MMPGNTTFAGMYGAIIITNDSEGTLTANGVLPASAHTFTLAMSDIEFLATDWTNSDMTVFAKGTVGRVGPISTNTAPTNFKTINQWTEDCSTAGADAADICETASKPGVTTLVNGEHPIARPGAETPLYTVPASKRIRLRLLNEALSRSFRLKLLDASGNQINLYRIGGQGGLLDTARLEGGTNGTWDTKYSRGEVNIGSGDRVDVLAYTSGTNGAILRLVGNPLSPPFLLSGATLNNTGVANIPSNYPIAFFKINGMTNDVAPTNGAPILVAVGEAVGHLGPATASLIDPATLGFLGTNNPVIKLSNASSKPAIDSIRPAKLDGNMGNGDWLTIPHTNSTRYAHVGDLLQLSVKNTTTPAHPFHLHGFSLQPVIVTDTNDPPNTLYTYGYDEFVDTIDVYGGQTLVFRVRLDDRPKFCDESPSFPPGPVLVPCSDCSSGGAIGRWLLHCHIFPHAGLGMISELTVVPDNLQTNQSKVIQNPDVTTNGVDVLATAGSGSQLVADDFLCTTSGPITQISIWGSWLNDVVDTNVTFELKFWTDVPGSPSHPGTNLWQQVFAPGSYSNSLTACVNSERFYDPSQPLLTNADTRVSRYDFTIPQTAAFCQRSGNIYWLSVTAITTNALFGWKTCITNDHFNDDATWSMTTNSPTSWFDLHYPPPHPYQGQSMDMAFALTTAACSNCPVAGFFGNPTNGPTPLMVTFTDTSTGAITNRFWNFGDGNTTNVTLTGVSHTYTNAGSYSVTLIVSGPCSDSTNTQPNYIVVSCPPPVANFAGAPTNGPAPLMVNFTAFPGGTITNWFWNFGDGGTTNITTTSISHIYTNAGTYTVTLIVSGPCGTSTNTKTNYITACAALVANFTGSPTNGTAPLTVLFLDASTGTITNRFWSFGDTGSSSVASPSHTYSNAGVYSVSLTVFGPCGMAFTNRFNYITVLTPSGPSYTDWQTNYFPGGGLNSLPDADPDGDGMSNTNEFLAGFNPTNNTAYLRIISLVRSNNDIWITYLGANGDNTWSPGIASRTNVLEFTRGTVIFGSNIVATGSYSNNFVGLITNILSGGTGLGTNVTVTETGGATNTPARYYRIRVLLP
jgi:PKD repeat protein/FtsP/CotA-like multicopper oxidase with cupredoxin domain